MSNSIVNVNVSQDVASTPSDFLRKGCFISQGGTTGAAGAQTLLTQLSDLTAILDAANATSALAWAGGQVTVGTGSAHGIPNATTFWVTIAGAAPSGYNGNYLATVTNSTHFTYALAGDPGAETVLGTWQVTSTVELLAMATTFFAQGSNQAIYVNELGIGSPANGVTALGAWITANPDTYYAYVVPRKWAEESTYLTFLASFEALTSKIVFFTTMTNSNRTSFTNLMNCVFGFIEAPSIPATEFSVAAVAYVTLSYAPSGTTKVTPLQFSFLYGVTPYPTAGNGALFTTWKAAGVNYAATGSEGGISNVILKWGTMMDVRPFNYWYAVDWVQINIALDIANAVIDGSNNPLNPLYLNQDGIDRLQGVGKNTLSRGVSFGIVFGKVQQTAYVPSDFVSRDNDGEFNGLAVINADPFTDYYKTNPSDYRTGTYGGYAASFSPQLGFDNITFNINVTDFVA